MRQKWWKSLTKVTSVSWYDQKGIIEIDGGTKDVQELGLGDDQLSNCLFCGGEVGGEGADVEGGFAFLRF